MVAGTNAAGRRHIDTRRVFEVDVSEVADCDVVQGLRRRIADDVRDGTLEFPPLPQVAMELGNLAASIDPDMQVAMRLVERDNQLAGRVIRVAASPAMGGRSVTDLRGAVMALGVNGLRDLAFAASMGKVFRCAPLDALVRTEMLHAFVVAIGSAAACRMLAVGERYGFLCGLFHDIGRVAVFMALSRYGRAEPTYWDSALAGRAADALHAELGPLVLSSWGLHNMVTRVAEHHHRPARAGAAMPLCLAVATVDAADRLVAESPEARAEALCALPLGYQAGLDAAQLATIAQVVHTARNDDILARLTG